MSYKAELTQVREDRQMAHKRMNRCSTSTDMQIKGKLKPQGDAN